MEARKDMGVGALRDMHRTLNAQGFAGRRKKITQRRRDTQRNAEERRRRRGEERRGEERRNRIAGRASESVIEFACASGARRKRMRSVLAGVKATAAVAFVVVGFCMGGAGMARADNMPAPKGPDEDGTKPALVKIAGEGMMDSHAFQYLTELSDDIGARVA